MAETVGVREHLFLWHQAWHRRGRVIPIFESAAVRAARGMFTKYTSQLEAANEGHD